MTAPEFMSRVVAWPGAEIPGYINFHWTAVLKDKLNGSGKPMTVFSGRPFSQLDAFMEQVADVQRQPAFYKDVYFCLSTQSQATTNYRGNPKAIRSVQNVTALKALWLDIDVGKTNGYETIEEAVVALKEFHTAANLPAPSALVRSGGGLHVYWISKTPLDLQEWRGYAEGLRVLVRNHGLKCDAALTTDAVRVLRIPGTFNWKMGTARSVKLVYLGEDYEYSTALGHIKGEAGAVDGKGNTDSGDIANWGPPDRALAALAQSDSLAAGIQGHQLLRKDSVIANCAHFKQAQATGGAKDSQGLWALTLLACTFFEDGRDFAHECSRGYPSYSEEETDKKYDEKERYQVEKNLGWPACKSFENEGAVCKSCTFYGKVRSPLNLAAPVSAQFQEVVPLPPPDMLLPNNAFINGDGFIAVKEERLDRLGETHTTFHQLFFSKLRNPDLVGGAEPGFRCETSLDKDNWRDVFIPEQSFSTVQSLILALYKGGVKTVPNEERYLRHFMVSWTTKIDEAKTRSEPACFGWIQPEGEELPTGFAYGGEIFNADGSVGYASAPDPQLRTQYYPHGEEEPWWELHTVITFQRHPALEVIAVHGFAAPLMYFSGYYNGVICAWSAAGGTHKSTSIALGASIWGMPQMTKLKPTSTDKGMMRRLGWIKNLPIYLDEVSDSEKMLQVVRLAGPLTEGGFGDRLRADRTMYSQDTWCSLVLVGSNLSFVEATIANIKDTDAQLRRVFEFKVEDRGDTLAPHRVAQMVSALDRNYGIIGRKYAALLGRNPAAVKETVLQTMERFTHAVQCRSKDRFRVAMAACLWAGAHLANENLGTSFHLDDIWQFLIDEFYKQDSDIMEAASIAGSKPHTLSAMTYFVKEHTRHVLTVSEVPETTRGRPRMVTCLAGPNSEHPNQVEIRIALADRTIDISKARLVEFFADRGKNSRGTGHAIIGGLIKHFDAEPVQRVNLAYGSAVPGMREPILRLKVPPGSPFEDLLMYAAPADFTWGYAPVEEVKNEL